MNGNLFCSKKPPFHRYITVANKRCQTTVILTVPPVLKPCGFIFMEPGFVSYRLIRPVILKSLLVKLNCGWSPEGNQFADPDPAGLYRLGYSCPEPLNKPTNQRPILSNQASKCWSNSYLNPKVFVLVTRPSCVDLSEAEPHGSVLFQTRLKSFFPKIDELQLFNPGEQPFISRLEKQIYY